MAYTRRCRIEEPTQSAAVSGMVLIKDQGHKALEVGSMFLHSAGFNIFMRLDLAALRGCCLIEIVHSLEMWSRWHTCRDQSPLYLSFAYG
jgi:hypothetical protein